MIVVKVGKMERKEARYLMTCPVGFLGLEANMTASPWVRMSFYHESQRYEYGKRCCKRDRLIHLGLFDVEFVFRLFPTVINVSGRIILCRVIYVGLQSIVYPKLVMSEGVIMVPSTLTQ